eukprot:scaffold1186_cov399-Prasinococcus_capsulatus_cf.AAC.8
MVDKQTASLCSPFADLKYATSDYVDILKQECGVSDGCSPGSGDLDMVWRNTLESQLGSALSRLV